jgi:hypothetical protein
MAQAAKPSVVYHADWGSKDAKRCCARAIFKGAAIQASIDGASVANVTDASPTKGMAGIGTGWSTAQFDNSSIK